MSKHDKHHDLRESPTTPVSSTSMERRMDLDLDYARVHAALDMDAIAAAGAEHAASAAQTTPPSRPALDCRRWSRVPMAACFAAILLVTAGLVMGAGWLVANLSDMGVAGVGGLPPLFPWVDRGDGPSDGPADDTSQDIEVPDVDETRIPWHSTTEPAEDYGGVTVAPIKPGEPMTESVWDAPTDPDNEHMTELGTESAEERPDETAPFGPSVTVGGVTYYDTGYAIPLGVLRDRLHELGAAADDRVCYAVVGLDSGNYIVATAHDHCYLYKTDSAPDPAAWLEAWLKSLQS